MPQPTTVEAPILVIGAVRSGSSWLLHVLNQHPDVSMLVENRAVEAVYHEVFHSYWSANWEWVCPPAEVRARAIAAARAVLCSLFPTQTPAWGMKLLSRGRPWDFIREVFPQARFIHATRCPTTALPSMMDFVGSSYSVWRDLEFCESQYVDAHEEALALAETGVPYLRVRQEDAATDPARVWDEITRFCGIRACPVPGLRDEINAAASTRGRVRDTRPPLAWSQLSAPVLVMAQRLSYVPPRAMDAPAATPNLVGALEAQVSQLTAAREALHREVDALRRENRQLRLRGGLGELPVASTDGEPTTPTSQAAASAGDGPPPPTDAAPPNTDPHAAAAAPAAHPPAGLGLRARIEQVRVLDHTGQPCQTIAIGAPYSVEVALLALAALDRLSVSFKVVDERGSDIFGTTTFDERRELPELQPGEHLTVRFSVGNLLRPGAYAVTGSINRLSRRDYSDNELLDQRFDACTFTVPRDADRPVHYVVHQPVEIAVLVGAAHS